MTSYSMCNTEPIENRVVFSEINTNEKKLRIVVIVLVLLICGLIAALISLAVLDKKPKLEEICIDASCVKTANFILESMNTSVDPCEDFYQFSCGKWIANNLDGGGIDVIQITTDKLDKKLIEMLESAEKRKEFPKCVSKIKKAFEVCLKYEGLDEENMAWIKSKTKEAGGFPLIDDTFTSYSSQWTDTYVKQFKTYINDFPLSIMIFANLYDSTENVIHISQPSSDWELEPLTKDLLNEIATHFSNSNNDYVVKDIEDILWFQEKVHSLQRPSQELMEDKNEHELVTIKKLNLMYPKIEWKTFLSNLLEDFLSPGTTINDSDKVFLEGKTYIGEIIEFFQKNTFSERMLLNYGGAMFINLLWTYNYVEDSNLRLKLKRKRSANIGLKYSQCKYFIEITASPVLDYLYGKHRKERYISQELIDYMVKAMQEMVADSTWLDEPTKKAVKDKLDHMVTFIGLPPWTQNERELENYFKELPEMTDNTFDNMLKLQQFHFKKTVELYRQKNDRSKWPRYTEMGGSQVNAYYVHYFNIAVIPAGIQQLPCFNAERPNYMNFAGMGLIYGHEMTHGLDESGSLRDKYGNLKNWWTEKTKDEFRKRSKCFVDQYNSYHYDGLNITVDGKQTLSENIADNGGIRQAFLGYRKWVRDNGEEKRLPGLENYSPEQLFFISFAETWCSSIHPPSKLAEAHENDEHAANQFRVIGSLSNMKEFSEVFNCKPESKMNPEHKCIMW